MERERKRPTNAIDRGLYEPASPEEIKRRQKVLKRILKQREQMPPLGLSTAELVRRARRREAGLDD